MKHMAYYIKRKHTIIAVRKRQIFYYGMCIHSLFTLEADLRPPGLLFLLFSIIFVTLTLCYFTLINFQMIPWIGIKTLIQTYSRYIVNS